MTKGGPLKAGGPPALHTSYHLATEGSEDMVSDAQKRANAKYRKKRMKQVTVRFSPNEMDVYDFLRGHENVSGYLKRLVREDMGRHSTISPSSS